MFSMLLLSACLIGNFGGTIGNGNVVNDTRTVEDWSQLQVEGGISVEVTADTPGEVTVRTDSNLMDSIETVVDGGTLTVKVRDGEFIGMMTTLTVVAGSDNLSSVTASGGSQVEASFHKNDAIQLVATGGSVIRGADLQSATVTAGLSGGSVMELAGTADHLHVDASGGSALNSADLLLLNAMTLGSGGSTVEISASGVVTGDMSGGSVLVVHGGADTTAVTQSGGSEVVEE